MDTFLWLFLLSTSMFLGSLLAGSIPLVFQMSESRLKTISAFGVGLLVGTSLIVIIPEGIETLYSVPSYYQKGANQSNLFADVPLEDKRFVGVSNDNKRRSSSNNGDDGIIDNLDFDNYSSSWNKRDIPEVDGVEINETGGDGKDGEKSTTTTTTTAIQPQSSSSTSTQNLPDNKTPENENHYYIGIALISGFAMMFVIDQMDAPHLYSHGHNSKTNVISLTDLRTLSNTGNVDRDIDIEDADEMMMGVGGSNTSTSATSSSSIHYSAYKNHNKSISATLGLIIHAAADGIALGASANEPTLETIVFLAIMLHKAPSAFGLSTILLREGFTRRQIRKHLAAFCLSAPLSSLGTYALLQQSGKFNPITMQWWTSILLLFSGGTFLYVAMHVMQDVTNGHKDGIGGGGGGHHGKLTKSHVSIMLIGMFLPLFLQLEHGHGH